MVPTRSDRGKIVVRLLKRPLSYRFGAYPSARPPVKRNLSGHILPECTAVMSDPWELRLLHEARLKCAESWCGWSKRRADAILRGCLGVKLLRLR